MIAVNIRGLVTMLAIQVRVSWKAIVAWIVALAATMVGTTLSISSLYDTPGKIHSYARALGGGGALELINGHVAGVDSLGGVIANEFGFVASFAVPLMGISLVARSSRRDEESGRLELLLAGRIGRSAPLVAALVVTAAALVLTSAALFGGLVAAGVPASGSVVYAASLGALGLVFAGIAAVAAQLVEHARGVYAIGLGALVAAYLLRGVGDVLDNPLTWLSPLGWAEEARAFGDARWWPLLISLGIAVVLVIAAVWVTGVRDLDSVVWSRLHLRTAAPQASRFLRSPFGFAVALHRGAILGWAAGAVLVAGAFGALVEQATDAVAGNASLRQVVGSGESGDGYLSMAVLLLALVCGAYVVQAAGSLRGEEASGRLEPVLAGPVGRRTWLAMHVVTILAGLLVVAACGAVALVLAAGWSTGDLGDAGRLLVAVASYLPAVLVLASIAFLLFAAVPRAYALAWLAYGFLAAQAMLGDLLRFPDWLSSISPMDHVGYPPLDPASGVALAMLAAVAAVLCTAVAGSFRHRGIPQG